MFMGLCLRFQQSTCCICWLNSVVFVNKTNSRLDSCSPDQVEKFKPICNYWHDLHHVLDKKKFKTITKLSNLLPVGCTTQFGLSSVTAKFKVNTGGLFIECRRCSDGHSIIPPLKKQTNILCKKKIKVCFWLINSKKTLNCDKQIKNCDKKIKNTQILKKVQFPINGFFPC